MNTKHFLTLLTFYTFALTGQINLPIDKTTGNAVFTEVITVDSVSAEDLYNRAKLFIATSYNSAQNVTQMADDKQHTLVIKAYRVGNCENWAGPGTFAGFTYTFKIFCKDNRYKYEISDIIHTKIYDPQGSASAGGRIENEIPDGGMNKMMKKIWASLRLNMVNNTDALINSLKTSMSKKSEIQNKEW